VGKGPACAEARRGEIVRHPREERVTKANAPGRILAVLLAACAPTGPYLWVDDYLPPPTEAKPYVIGIGDVIQVRVFNQEQMSTKGRVREDGKISLPLLNDVEAAGLSPVALAEQLQNRLKDFIKAPLVTVSLEEARPQVVLVTGEVAHPGVYPLEVGDGVLAAIARGGGLTPDADGDRIFVLRQQSPPTRIRFRHDALLKMIGKAPSFKLRQGDVVVVE
jgi:polysaccharide export outer membrane protein